MYKATAIHVLLIITCGIVEYTEEVDYQWPRHFSVVYKVRIQYSHTNIIIMYIFCRLNRVNNQLEQKYSLIGLVVVCMHVFGGMVVCIYGN